MNPNEISTQRGANSHLVTSQSHALTLIPTTALSEIKATTEILYM